MGRPKKEKDEITEVRPTKDEKKITELEKLVMEYGKRIKELEDSKTPVKKEKKTRAPTEWNIFAKAFVIEMKKEDPSKTLGECMKSASEAYKKSKIKD